MDLSFGYRTIISRILYKLLLHPFFCENSLYRRIYWQFQVLKTSWNLWCFNYIPTWNHKNRYLDRHQIQLLLNLRHEKYHVLPPPHKFAAWAMRTNYLGFTLIYIIKHSMYLFFHLSFQFHFTTVWKYTMASSVFLKITESIKYQ